MWRGIETSSSSEELNRTAERKLQQYLPGWRANGRPPVLVTVHRGVVQGHQGVRVYYRLTPLGEQLTAALASNGLRSEGEGERASA